MIASYSDDGSAVFSNVFMLDFDVGTIVSPITRRACG
jgi:hypothetical protein